MTRVDEGGGEWTTKGWHGSVDFGWGFKSRKFGNGKSDLYLLF